MTASDDRFVDRVWIPIWEAAWNYRRPRHGRRLLRLYGHAVAAHLRDTSDAPLEDWRMHHELLELPVPPMP
jgi:hypothetical protein